MTVTLAVSNRDPKLTTTQLRTTGFIPAIVYGPKQPNLPLTVEKKVFDKLFKTAGESTVVTLVGLPKPIEVLVHSVNFNPVQGGIQHVDFYAIEQGKEMTTHVALEFVGESAVEKGGGMVSKILHEVEVTCMPDVLPAHLTVDVSQLTEIDQKIHISDLTLPSGVKIHAAADDVVALAVAGGRDEVDEEVAEAVVVPALPE
jgi:large subunit ribosomal protein L25